MTRVPTTKIEKKYKDRQGNEKTLTIEYAKAADRIKQFREDCPRGSIETSFLLESGNIIFTAKVTKDLTGEGKSATATGHAMGKNTGEKSFEKLETISVARALALLGYLAGGEVASSEEMEEYYQYKEEKIETAIASMNDCESLEELKTTFMGLGSLMAEKAVLEAKDKRKAELS
jgi:hypothetical protein